MALSTRYVCFEGCRGGGARTTQPSKIRLPGARGKASPMRDAQHTLYQEVPNAWTKKSVGLGPPHLLGVLQSTL